MRWKLGEKACAWHGKGVWSNGQIIYDQAGGWIEVNSGIYHAPICSACGFVGERGFHDENGEVIDEGDLHVFTCSKCGAEGSAHEPGYGYGDCELCNLHR